jgi:hypothetical protein
LPSFALKPLTYHGQMENNSTPMIRDLYPKLSENELVKAGENLERYLALVLCIFERMEAEGFPQAAELTANNGTLRCTPSKGTPPEKIE